MKWIFILVGLSSLGLFIWWLAYSPTTIYIYDDRFEPASLSIPVGREVAFVSKATREVWPASDAHPSHQLYPEFDPQAPILPGEVWSFKFDRTGVWNFHDHLSSGVRGQINVGGQFKFGETSRDCVANETGVKRAACWEADFAQLIEQEGLEAAFEKFVEFYDTEPSFKDYCHDIMHYVGRAAYEVYLLDNSIVDRSETSYCGYGFYHGFIEASLEADGDLLVAKNYCEEVARRDPAFDEDGGSHRANACWHGIGHAAFDSLPGHLWGDSKAMIDSAINTCELYMTEKYPRRMCVTGVYNSLANALISHRYQLTYDPKSTVDICESQKPEYRDSCYLDLAVVYANSSRLSLREGIDYALTFPATSSRAHSIFGVVDDTFRRGTGEEPDLKDFVGVCEAFSLELYQSKCLWGLLIGVTYSSHKDNLTLRLEDLCGRFTNDFLTKECEIGADDLLKKALSE